MGVASVNVRFGADLKQFRTEIQKVTRGLKRTGRQLKRTGATLNKSLTLPLVALGAASSRMALTFDQNFTKIQTLVGVSADQVKEFKKEVLSLSGATGKSPLELSDALFTVTSAGLRGKQALDVLTMSAKASAVGMGETKEIARATTAIVQAYGIENISAARASDILTATIREGNLEASELAPVLGRVIGLASDMGVSFEEIGASVATFTRLGVDSSEAITGLRGVLSAIKKPTQEGQKVLAGMGLTFQDLRDQIKSKGLANTLINLVKTFEGNDEALTAIIPNVRALSTVLGTAGVQADSYDQILKNVTNSQGILGDAFAETSRSDSAKFQQALNNLKVGATALGSVLLPMITKVLLPLGEMLKRVAERFANLSPGIQKTIVVIGAVLAALGPLLTMLGFMATNVIPGLISAFKLLKLAMLSNPITLIATAVASLIGMYVAWNSVSSKQVSQISSEQAVLNALVEQVKGVSQGTKERTTQIQKLQQKYPDFLKNLDAEKVTNEQLETALSGANREFEKKIRLEAQQKDLGELYQRSSEALTEYGRVSLTVSKSVRELLKGSSIELDKNIDLEENLVRIKKQLAAEISKSRFDQNEDKKARFEKEKLLKALTKEFELLSNAKATYDVATGEIKKYKSESQKLNEQIDELTNSTNENKKTLNGSSGTIVNAAKSVKQLREEIQKLKDNQAGVTTNSEWIKYQDQINNIQAAIDLITSRRKEQIVDLVPRAIPDVNLSPQKLKKPYDVIDLDLMEMVNKEFYKQQAIASATNSEFDAAAVKANLMRKMIREAGEAYGFTSSMVEDLTFRLQAMDQEQSRINANISNMQLVTGVLIEGFGGMFDAMAAGGVDAFTQLWTAVKNLIKQMLVALTVAALLAAIFPAIGLGGKAAFSFKNIFSDLSGIKIPGLASGGIVTGPTLAMIGEGSESEAVMPLSKLETLLNTHSGNGGNVNVTGQLVFNGDQFITGLRQTKFSNSRWRNNGG